MKNQGILFFCLFSMSLVSSVHANDRSSNDAQYATDYTSSCPLVETSQINVNFNSQETDLSKINTIMDDKLKSIESLAKKAGLDKFEMQSMNYNLYVNNSGGCNIIASDGNTNSVYQLNGNISFTALPASKATDLMVELNKKGYGGSLSVNKYRQCR